MNTAKQTIQLTIQLTPTQAGGSCSQQARLFLGSLTEWPACEEKEKKAPVRTVSNLSLMSCQPHWVTSGQKGRRNKTGELKRRSKSHLSN